ncbi:ImmA/IrrE family metallo-endopeptidase [Moraxella bovis]|uniref:ImmA/IrrE family metallo-endopeptidase n=1 Tax=Moraxella bovis TaxID=476 RepID=UPI0022263212|nr:ImmA/IrrE family metallo-endopeptidase [Moraxella bovis]UYZ68454.1 ImmA/IrrE family metallo-endopeptidase [Moraxella bovis]UYZ70825.1 ImmA/IrrE family metallo-endopeptidase [Moraxella bovis]UZA14134.1 ImmA/IrrE family metallo-endopeptidase [Moraxella bovis]UZA27513.1 ImmA/IrrE family metallo-endopeptidase [Moraxella bovis]UZA37953.1 ImmA/IrrE family metallo-endopeptidase [Moraxella bovis]
MSRAVKYAQSVLKHYWDKQIPIQPERMIDKIDDLEIRYENLTDNISGKVNYDFDIKKYIITVNENHHENRQRFTIAHELGHYALNHGSKEYILYRNGESDPDEIEANAFAAEILMPTAVIRHLIFEKDITTVQELAQKLWVSEQAMLYRLKNLGLIS